MKIIGLLLCLALSLGCYSTMQTSIDTEDYVTPVVSYGYVLTYPPCYWYNYGMVTEPYYFSAEFGSIGYTYSIWGMPYWWYWNHNWYDNYNWRYHYTPDWRWHPPAVRPHDRHPRPEPTPRPINPGGHQRPDPRRVEPMPYERHIRPEQRKPWESPYLRDNNKTYPQPKHNQGPKYHQDKGKNQTPPPTPYYKPIPHTKNNK